MKQHALGFFILACITTSTHCLNDIASTINSRNVFISQTQDILHKVGILCALFSITTVYSAYKNTYLKPGDKELIGQLFYLSCTTVYIIFLWIELLDSLRLREKTKLL